MFVFPTEQKIRILKHNLSNFQVVVSRALLSDKSQLGVSAPMGTLVPHVPSLQPEIKLAGAGGIPVAISTTLPPAVARLSQQQGKNLVKLNWVFNG